MNKLDKVCFKFPLIIGIYNFFIVFVYFIFDNIIGNLILSNSHFAVVISSITYIIANPGYFAFSGFISGLAIVLALFFVVTKKIAIPIFIPTIIINVAFILFYINWLGMQ